MDVDELEQFAAGDLDEATRHAVEEHLSTCSGCRDRLGDVRQNLAVAGSLRSVMAGGRQAGAAAQPASQPAEESLPLPGGWPERIGPYRILDELGCGGMGVVYLAEQERPRRLVALKLIRPGATSHAALRRFEHEANLLAQLQHPGIAQVYDAGAIDGQPFLAMEYIRGTRLDAFAHDHDLDLRTRLRLLARVCDAVHHAHLRGVIHRDLKPGNILVVDESSPPFAPGSAEGSRTNHKEAGSAGRRLAEERGPRTNYKEADPTGRSRPKHEDRPSTASRTAHHDADEGLRIKVLDFGVARAIDPSLQTLSIATDTGQLLGTVPFMSPEQVSGDPARVDARTDVYAIGVVGYLLLSDRLPYPLKDRSLPEAARIIRDEEPARLGAIDTRLRGDVETILGKALEKDPDRRYASAAELAADLRRYLRDEPILARPAGTYYQFRKFARRNRALVGGAAAAMLALLAGAVASGVLAVQATRAERLAREEADKFEAVNTFLNDMLGQLDPVESPGEPDITVRAVMEQTAADLESGVRPVRPEVEVSVRTTIGNVYRALADYEQAEHHLRRAVEIGERTYTGDHKDLAFAMHKLSRVIEDTGRYEEADEWCRSALEMRRRIFDEPHREIATSLNNLGWLRFRMGRHEEGEALLEESLQMRRALYGDEHEEIANSLNNLAVAAAQRGDHERAEDYYRRSLEMDRALRGPLHPHVAATMSNLATLLNTLGRFDEAEPLMREALEMLRQIHGSEHPSIATLLNNLALLQSNLERLNEAEATYREALAMYRSLHGERHPATAHTMTNLGSLLIETGSLDEAEALIREALEIKQESFGASHPDTLVSVFHLAGLHAQQSEHDTAIALLDDAIVTIRDTMPPGHPHLGFFLREQGKSLTAAGRHNEAESALHESYDILLAAFGEENAHPKRVADALADLYEQTGREEDAAAWREKGTTSSD